MLSPLKMQKRKFKINHVLSSDNIKIRNFVNEKFSVQDDVKKSEGWW